MWMLVCLVGLIGSAWAETSGSVCKYQNPVGVSIADPGVFKDNGTYYAYGTSFGDRGFEVFTSQDLVHWRREGWALLKTQKSWGQDCFWAPEVIRKGDKYYMFYTAFGPKAGVRNICVARSASPLGPFEDVKAPLLPPERGFIDSHVYRDPVSKQYYFYALEENLRPPVIWGARLDDSLCELETTLTRCLTASQSWEHEWTEAPFVVRHGDWYYMMYSGFGYSSPSYAIGYATARDLLGPWTKYEGNPVIKKTAECSGPGHNSVVASPDGSELFVCYHRHLSFTGGCARELAIDPIRFVASSPGAPDLLTVPGGASSEPRPLPAGAVPHARGVSDEFDAKELDFSRWMTMGESPGKYRLEGGALVITTEDGDIWTDRTDIRNLLMQYAPEGDFTAWTRVQFDPKEDYEQACLIIMQDQSNYIRLSTVHDGERMLEAGIERDGAYNQVNIPNSLGTDVYLRVERKGKLLACSASSDGKTWIAVGAPFDLEMTLPKVALAAISPKSMAAREARFDFVRIEEGR